MTSADDVPMQKYLVEPLLPHRVLPALDGLNSFFWTSGQDGRLRFLQCARCGYFNHPPTPRCPQCLSTEVAPTVVSGRATLHSFTVNHQQWIPGTDRYVIGLAQLAEQDDLRLTSNVVEVSIEDVEIGMALEICFERHGEIYLPLFRPVMI